MPVLGLQPKQFELLELIEKSPATMIGAGGGRGAAKSGAIDRIALALLMGEPGTVGCIAMRNYDQVRKYHIEPLKRSFPELEAYYRSADAKFRIPVGGTTSELDFSYAENYDAVERRFRSGNYKFIFVDQAEQFDERELREMKKACRWPTGKATMLLAFNMGGAGIQTLRKWFHTKEYNDREDPTNYAFLKVNPWDNVEWCRNALASDGLTEADYYSWTDEQRMAYAAARGEYTKLLNSEDDVIRARDWLGSWESLEGAYFGRAYDRQSTLLAPDQAYRLIKPWSARWMSQDWGKAHYCSTHWHAKVDISPAEVKEVLGWNVEKPVKAVITYREHVVNETGSEDIARQLVELTPDYERKQLRRFFLSPDAFGERDSENTIAMKIGKILRPFEMPSPEQADNDRVGGWELMYDALLETKRHAADDSLVWLISAECPELLNAIPLLMRDPKNLDDVLKTDKGSAKVEQDVGDDVRYGLKSMLSPNKKPSRIIIQEAVAAAPNFTQAHLTHLKLTDKYKKLNAPIKRPLNTWRRGH